MYLAVLAWLALCVQPPEVLEHGPGMFVGVVQWIIEMLGIAAVAFSLELAALHLFLLAMGISMAVVISVLQLLDDAFILFGVELSLTPAWGWQGILFLICLSGKIAKW